MPTTEQVENLILEETLERHNQRVAKGDRDTNLIIPGSVDEIKQRIARAGSLSSNSPLRIGNRFLKETDPKLH